MSTDKGRGLRLIPLGQADRPAQRALKPPAIENIEERIDFEFFFQFGDATPGFR
jgi:hypothetical protein